MQNMESSLRHQHASIHSLEVQIDQVVKLISERSQVTLAGNTELNLREQVNVITLRSGKELPKVQEMKIEVEETVHETHEEKVAKDNENLEEVSREMIKCKDQTISFLTLMFHELTTLNKVLVERQSNVYFSILFWYFLYIFKLSRSILINLYYVYIADSKIEDRAYTFE